jgi:hypothetical protein
MRGADSLKIAEIQQYSHATLGLRRRAAASKACPEPVTGREPDGKLDIRALSGQHYDSRRTRPGKPQPSMRSAQVDSVSVGRPSLASTFQAVL